MKSNCSRHSINLGNIIILVKVGKFFGFAKDSLDDGTIVVKSRSFFAILLILMSRLPFWFLHIVII